jgi:predicted kinase
MAKLVMLRGLPASGKSTIAKEIATTGEYIRVNRDLLREMFHFSVWSGKNERLIVETETALTLKALNENVSVIVDDCNLNPDNETMWRGVAEMAKAKFEIVDVDTPYDVCIERDKDRVKKVGAHVIKSMALQYGLFPTKSKLIVCDIDGTIADIRHRQHWASGENKNWDRFFAEMDKDTVRKGVLMMLKEYSKKDHEVIFVSARPEDYREVTEKWLAENVDVPYLALIMRPSKDKREDSIVKTEIYNKYLKNVDIETVIDDRPRVIAAWRSLGLPVIDVGDGVDF